MVICYLRICEALASAGPIDIPRLPASSRSQKNKKSPITNSAHLRHPLSELAKQLQNFHISSEKAWTGSKGIGCAID
jgi:hypothetical protein